MFQCKWKGCDKSYLVYNLLVEHVNDHIIAVEPQNFPIDDGKESAHRSPALSTSSAKNLSLSRDSQEEIDLMSETSGEDTNVEIEDDDVECEICGSGTEQDHDLIVLCDGCDLGYHQKCHPVIISDSLLKAEESLWYCYNCQPASTSRS